MKKGKELKLNKFKNYKTILGSIDYKNPKALYISISTWASPKSEVSLNYNREIKNLDKEIRRTLYSLMSSQDSLFLKDESIVDLDIRESGIKFGKKSFTNCEITLFLKKEIPINSDKVIETSNDIFNKMINNVFEKNKIFSFHKKKN
jgi:hypothetical protein